MPRWRVRTRSRKFAPAAIPTGIHGEVVWTASAAPAAMLSGAATLADGTTGEVWITRADGAGSALEFGIR